MVSSSRHIICNLNVQIHCRTRAGKAGRHRKTKNVLLSMSPPWAAGGIAGFPPNLIPNHGSICAAKQVVKKILFVSGVFIVVHAS
jgi:hypothetical protein